MVPEKGKTLRQTPNHATHTNVANNITGSRAHTAYIMVNAAGERGRVFTRQLTGTAPRESKTKPSISMHQKERQVRSRRGPWRPPRVRPAAPQLVRLGAVFSNGSGGDGMGARADSNSSAGGLFLLYF